MNNPPERPPRRPIRRRKRRIKILPAVLLILLVIFLITAVFTLFYVGRMMKELPEWGSTDLETEQTSFLYDRNGDYYGELHKGENRTSVSLSDMPPYLIDCFLSTEDTRFYKHFGVDVWRIFGAFVADLKAGGVVQGASTITMQLARNAILETQEKELDRKVKEALLAIEIEKHFTKDEILEMYLNEIYFGHGCYGVQAASQLFFGKDVQDISLQEAAVLTGVIRSWVYYSPLKHPDNTLKVRNQVLTNLIAYDESYKADATAAMATELVLADHTSDSQEEGESTASNESYAWFTDYIIDQTEDILEDLGMDGSQVYTGGLKIYTTMEPDVQGYMEELYTDDTLFPESSTADQVQSAMVVMDHSNGDILGLIGGRTHETQRAFSRATDMRRQPGSVFKPIAVYAAALESGYSPASVANDVSTVFGKNYTPSNYDGKYRGVISMRTAIQYSVNIPAVKFLQKIGVETGYNMAQKLGIQLDGDNDKNLAIALGGLTKGASPLEIAAAYGTFANSGIYNQPRAILKIESNNGDVIYEATPSQTVAMRENTAYLLTNMLETVTQAGTGTNAKMNRPVASKTGTTQLPDTAAFKNVRGNKDAWFAAYTPELVGVVWMGYDQDVDSEGNPQYLKQIYGGKYPAQLWKKVMTEALKDVKVTAFSKPSDIVSVAIDTKSGLLPSDLTPAEFIKQEVFAKANAPTEKSDIWQQVEVCSSSGKLVTNFCPNPVVKVLFTPPTETNKIMGTGADSDLQVPTTTCTEHTTIQANTVAVNICTDARHSGKLVLANPRGNGGGCPEDTVVTRYFSPGNVPTEYCDLPDHQPATPVTPDNGNDDNHSGSDDKDDENNVTLTAPSSLSGTVSISGDKYNLRLTWSDSANSPNTLYEIERWEDADMSKKKSVKTYFRNWDDKGLSGTVTYSYRVRAVNENTNATSPWTATFNITPGEQ